ncbi:unnamed protein product [Nippostrongylus brasiliensis]|uniref:BAR domain-containing protein n=1 Tax=Nippostrongylus brasiliensis TaxID=27835 RepID=A0A0N4Y4G2_NIPBR|nr:unnamed protein product [Nippostrongylus brasiliensis]
MERTHSNFALPFSFRLGFSWTNLSSSTVVLVPSSFGVLPVEIGLDLYRKSLSLLERSKEMMSVVNQLQPSGRKEWSSTVQDTSQSLENLVQNIRRSSDFEFEVDRAMACYKQCVQRVDHTISELKVCSEFMRGLKLLFSSGMVLIPR